MAAMNRRLRELLHWLIAIAAVLQLLSCVFMGASYMPAVPF